MSAASPCDETKTVRQWEKTAILTSSSAHPPLCNLHHKCSREEEEEEETGLEGSGGASERSLHPSPPPLR